MNNDINITLNSSRHNNRSPRVRASSFLELNISNDEYDTMHAHNLIPHSNNRYLTDLSHGARYLEETDISTEPNFYFCIVALIVIYLINLFLFMTRVINSQFMLLYDTALSLLVCLVIVIVLNKYSWRVRNLLLEFGTVNNAIYTYNNIQRILIITYISSAFLLIKLLIELAFLVNFGMVLLLFEGFVHASATDINTNGGSPGLTATVVSYWSTPVSSPPRDAVVVTAIESQQQSLLNKHWDMYVLLKNILECIFASLIVLIPYISRRNINVVVGSQSEHGQSSSSHHTQQQRVHQSVTVISVHSQDALNSNYNSITSSNEPAGRARVVTPRSACANKSTHTSNSTTTEHTYLL